MQTNNLYNHANYRSGPTISNPKARKRATRILQKGARRPSNAQGLFAVTPRPHLPGRFRGLFWDGSLTSLSTRRRLGNGPLPPVLRCLQVLRCRRLGNALPPRMMEGRPSSCFIDSRCCAAARCCAAVLCRSQMLRPSGTAERHRLQMQHHPLECNAPSPGWPHSSVPASKSRTSLSLRSLLS